MTTATLVAGNRMMDHGDRSGPGAAWRSWSTSSSPRWGSRMSLRLIRIRRRRRRSRARRARSTRPGVCGRRGDVDGALGVLGDIDAATAAPKEARWAFSEWKGLVRRRFGSRGALVYSQGTGRAAALVPTGDGGTLEVVAALGMRWRPGKVVSGRSLRGLRPLAGGA